MQNALLLSSFKLSYTLSQLSGRKRPKTNKELRRFNNAVVRWYEMFTDIPKKELKAARKQYDLAVKSKKITASKKRVMHQAVLSAVDFLNAYIEPAEIINMTQYGSDKKRQKALKKMASRMGAFHKNKMGSLKWIMKWLEKVDPLFPSESMTNKLACCFSEVAAKPCFEINQVCFFDPQLDWINTPLDRIPGMASQDDCCQGSTLSSCSGGTLYCDCVAGNTGCDCQAPNQLCAKNDKDVNALIPGFGDSDCMILNETAGIPDDLSQPLRELLDAETGSTFAVTRTSVTLDVKQGRFRMPQNMHFDLGRMIMLNKECQQTGFCPPQSNGCPGLA